MKIVFLAGLICALCLISVAKAAPADGDIVEEPEAVNPSSGELEQEAVNTSTGPVNSSSGELAAENPDNSDRENSGTCSFGSWACKTHCWAIGRGTGYCSSGVCYCY